MLTDGVIPFVFETLPVRGAVVRLDKSWQRMLLGHDYEPTVRDVLGQAAAAGTLIAQSVKADSSITLQISGQGPLSMLVMQCTSALEFRGMANAARGTEGLDFTELVAKARCAITIDSQGSERPYQGIVEVAEESLAESLEHYYQRSAQLASHVRLLADERIAAGLLLQQMPGSQGLPGDDWRRLGLLADTLRGRDFENGIGLDLVGRLFAEDDVRVFESRPAVFRCRCSRRRAERVLRLLGETECREACEEQGRLVVTCEYCGRRRRFDAVDVAQLFAEPLLRGSDTIH